MRYDEEIKSRLEGKAIIKADVDGYGMTLELSDGSVFDYCASDGGYSRYGFDDEEDE